MRELRVRTEDTGNGHPTVPCGFKVDQIPDDAAVKITVVVDKDGEMYSCDMEVLHGHETLREAAARIG